MLGLFRNKRKVATAPQVVINHILRIMQFRLAKDRKNKRFDDIPWFVNYVLYGLQPHIINIKDPMEAERVKPLVRKLVEAQLMAESIYGAGRKSQ